MFTWGGKMEWQKPANKKSSRRVILCGTNKYVCDSCADKKLNMVVYKIPLTKDQVFYFRRYNVSKRRSVVVCYVSDTNSLLFTKL